MGEMEHKKHSTEMKPYKRTHSRYVPRNEMEEAIVKCEVQNYGGDFCSHLVPIHWRKKAFSRDTLPNTLMMESCVMVGPTLEAWACTCAWRCMACIGGAVFWRGSVPAMHGRAVFWQGNVPGVHAILPLGVTRWVKPGSCSRLGPRATLAPREPRIRYYRGFSLLRAIVSKLLHSAQSAVKVTAPMCASDPWAPA